MWILWKTEKRLVFLGKRGSFFREMQCAKSGVFHISKTETMENVEKEMWKVKKNVEKQGVIR